MIYSWSSFLSKTSAQANLTTVLCISWPDLYLYFACGKVVVESRTCCVTTPSRHTSTMTIQVTSTRDWELQCAFCRGIDHIHGCQMFRHHRQMLKIAVGGFLPHPSWLACLPLDDVLVARLFMGRQNEELEILVSLRHASSWLYHVFLSG